ncbi:MAG: 7-cyano-7-deazaguanine synthase [Nitrosopumilus sp.]|nr:7-cyano-7-deazaguanine synthase [Nitrosopumilus sp.]
MVFLASGGLDSSVLLWKMKRDGHDVVPLFIDYGQKAAVQEHRAAAYICREIGIRLRRIDIPGLSRIDNGLSDPVHGASHVFHARNMILFSVAASLAASRYMRVIGAGIRDDSFPDQARAFVDSSEEALTDAVGSRMILFAPLVTFSKLEVARLGRDDGVPMDVTYSCYMGGPAPCRRCPSCLDRQRALDLAWKD